MTPAERMRRHRQAKRDGTSLAPARAAQHRAEAFGRSERWGYYARDLEHYAAPELVALLEPPHRIGIRLVLAIARTFEPDTQRYIAQTFRTKGRAAGLELARRCSRVDLGTRYPGRP